MVISSANAAYVGTPAATPERPVIDTSYDFGLTVLLEDVERQDAYQVDPIHLEFVNGFKEYWTRVAVYDVD